MSLDIVSLIENNPLTCLNGDYNSKLLNKIQQEFTDSQQRLFVSSFYCYLNHDQNKDFVVDLDNVWKWLGFSRKDKAKRLLEQNFKENIDYCVAGSCPEKGNASDSISNGEKVKQEVMMSVRTFKKLCLKARTSKADEIHDYFIMLENIINDLIMEESTDLQKKLQVKDLQKENTLISNFNRKAIVYIGLVESNIIKFGYTDNIEQRLKSHKREICNNFTFEYVYESVYNREIERFIKKKLKERIFSKIINSKTQTELIKLDNNFNIDDLDEEIRKIKDEIESTEKDKNKNMIIEALNLKIKLLTSENENLKDTILDLETENHKLKTDLSIVENNKKIIDIQLNSMQSLGINIMKIKKAVCINFFVNFISNHIKINDNKLDIIINIDLDKLYDEYKQYRLSNKYTEPLHDKKYELGIITRTLKNLPGVYSNRKKSGMGYKIIHIETVVNWMIKNINIPKHLRYLFIQNKCDYYNYKTKNEDKELEHIHNFLLNIVLRHTCSNEVTSRGNPILRRSETPILELGILNTIISAEYMKFYLQDGYFKRLTITKIRKVFLTIPGIYEYSQNRSRKSLKFDLNLIRHWMNENLILNDNLKRLLWIKE